MVNHVCPHCGEKLGSYKPLYCAHCRRPLDEQSRRGRVHSTDNPPNDAYRESAGSSAHSQRLAEGLQVFAQRLFQMTPRTRVTQILLAINVAMFVVMVIGGVPIADPSAQVLYDWGASRGVDTVDGQWWRLLTCTIIHVGLIHLICNMWCLYALGPLAERLVGPVGFLILYVASGLAGSLASAVWSPLVVSAGASGSIFGIFGAVIGIYMRAKKTIPAVVFQQHRSSLGTLLIINLIIGLTVPRIDMAGHVGGLIAGILCGWALGHPINPEGASRRNIRNALTTVGATILLVVFAWIVRERLGWMNASFDEMLAIERTQHRLIEQYNDAVARKSIGQLTDEEFVDILERDILPGWKESRMRLDRTRIPPRVNEKYVADLRQCMSLREEAIDLFARAVRANDVQLSQQAKQKMREADQIVERMAADVRNLDK